MFIKSALKMSDDIPKIRYIYYRCVYGFYKIMYAILTKCIHTCTYNIYAIERVSGLTGPPPSTPTLICAYTLPLSEMFHLHIHTYHIC